MNNKTAVVLFNLGGPDSLNAVQPFLENLFNDPDIFKLPFQKSLARYISKKRAPKVQKEYELIGGKSPLNHWTEIQKQMLESNLRSSSVDCDVLIAMRYWNPLTSQTALEAAARKYSKIILLPLYPHFSVSTTGSSFNEWKRVYPGSTSEHIFIDSYPTHPEYIKAINERIDETLLKFQEGSRDNVQLVFSAHGTPVSYVKKGDPYSHHISETISAVMKMRNNSHQHHLCFQSKVGPAKWLEPATDDMIKKLSAEGKKSLLVIPVSFVSDHVETDFELAIEYKHVADEAGIDEYIVMKGLNDSQLFINALADLVLTKLK
ncbi:MAG: ferrochelatase [Ignavibacteriales bacterium]|nr:MAG: ferrochelatase [Ignavibacteriales bacterium]